MGRAAAPRPVHPKVLDLFASVEKGFTIADIGDGGQGSVVLLLRRGVATKRLRFEHFEVPAMLQAIGRVDVAT